LNQQEIDQLGKIHTHTASTEVQNVSEGNIEISKVENLIRIELEPKTESIIYLYSVLLWFSASEYYFHSQNYTVRDSSGGCFFRKKF
jgi:hypothetical protein